MTAELLDDVGVLVAILSVSVIPFALLAARRRPRRGKALLLLGLSLAAISCALFIA